jgi:hypothetical protein
MKTMLIYWVLFLIPAAMAVTAPERDWPGFSSRGQAIIAVIFAGVYVAVSFARYEVGADWYAYEQMYVAVLQENLADSLSITDPIFSFLLWISAQIGGDVYWVNAICSLILVSGVLRVAKLTREPWLAIAVSVPYLLIVVGFGYVRQGAAIGCLLWAISTIDRRQYSRTLGLVIIASGLHSTAIVLGPVIAFAAANRNKLAVLGLTSIAAVSVALLAERASYHVAAHYIDIEMSSSGALVRLLMVLLPSLLLLARWSVVDSPYRLRMIWLGMSLASFVALVALWLTPSSTLIDRMALYLTPVQLYVFGELRRLIGLSRSSTLLVRMLGLAIGAAVMMIWLNFATHASDWVPYEAFWQRE